MNWHALGRSPAWRCTLIWTAIVLAGAAARWWLRDLPNFAPVAAIALFSGYFFNSLALAMLAPISMLLLTDLMIGGYSASWGDMLVLASVYGALALPALFRGPLRRWMPLQGQGWKGGAAAVGLIGCSLACSLLFFLVTNLAVWMAGDWYERSWAGLMQCYGQALPFFRNTLVGDLTFATALFGIYAAIKAPLHHDVLVAEPVRRSSDVPRNF